MNVWNNDKWWAEGGVFMLNSSNPEDQRVVITDPVGGKRYSISPKDGENIDLWAKNGLTPSVIARLLIGLTNKDPILGGVITYFDEFAKAGVSVEEAKKQLNNALEIIEGPSLAEFGKDPLDPST